MDTHNKMNHFQIIMLTERSQANKKYDSISIKFLKTHM